MQHETPQYETPEQHRDNPPPDYAAPKLGSAQPDNDPFDAPGTASNRFPVERVAVERVAVEALPAEGIPPETQPTDVITPEMRPKEFRPREYFSPGG